ncbi:hypothetical protein DICPUDRAFT_81065 [Dictyostelium purpureum]|uniref:Uncharacterized protein n=1 Tax=Dictyostelium purpureum TaxID=5786 RepID=F0ZSD5_DICPU|nr:uncharacterized protein DICPUDRAFT_81065 [Dictyostelium purpureum]EGC33130.1 hypothetical protein DICPUDRAFT_81065 [Dictyostelium purpureum]|eukprot:XP_003290325.1 hypothetical protein DICPUDRAFT_81065 [Dictyostelium purpureum]
MLTSINKINKSIIINSISKNVNNIASYSTAPKQQKKSRRNKGEEEEGGNDNISKYDIKVSKGSYQKIISGFTQKFRRPDQINTKRSEEEVKLRKIIYEYEKYSKDISKRRDQEEVEKLRYQFDAVMELPEDLRKIALLVDTRDEQPELIQFLTDTPPTKTNPKENIQLKKKDPTIKSSKKLFLNNSN